MLGKRTGSKANYLTQSDLDNVNDAYENRSIFTDYELTWLGVPANKGHGEQEEKIMKIDNSPIDVDTEKKTIDIRDLHEQGGDGA